MTDLLTLDFLGRPAWLWMTFVLLVLGLLAFDLGIFHRGSRAIEVRESLVLSAIYIALGLAFGGFIAWQAGGEAAVQYLTGFVIEKSLAVDNVFVIALIFAAFSIPRELQHRALFWGVLGVIVLRGIVIAAGAALVTRFEWVLYVFAAVLVVTGAKMLLTPSGGHDGPPRWLRLLTRHVRVTEGLRGARFLVREPRVAGGPALLHATPLLLALVAIEIADVIFAIDSVPAIFAITTDPFVVYTSNIFAILGLRALYFALAAALHRFAYLEQALAILLVFIGSKLFVADLMGWENVPPALSLGVTFAILAGGVGWSLWRTRAVAPAPAARGAR